MANALNTIAAVPRGARRVAGLNARRLVNAPPAEVGVEHDGGGAPQRPRANSAYTQPLADRGVRSVTGSDSKHRRRGPRASG